MLQTGNEVLTILIVRSAALWNTLPWQAYNSGFMGSGFFPIR